MKKLLVFTTLIINSIFAFGQTEWKILQRDSFQIEYPGNWELNETGLLGTRFFLFSELSGPTDAFRENINLMTQNLTGYNMTLDRYVELSESQIKTLITDCNIIESSRILDEESEHHKIVYTGKQGEFDLKFIQYYWVVDNTAFVLTFSAEINAFDEFAQTAEKIMDSFKAKK